MPCISQLALELKRINASRQEAEAVGALGRRCLLGLQWLHVI